MKKILFVCHGNICRSVMAQFVFDKSVKDRHLEHKYSSDSAATHRDELGNDIYPPIRRTMDNHHIPYTRHYARLMKSDDYDKFDILVGLDDKNISDMRYFFNYDPGNKIRKLRKDDVEDPWWTDRYEAVYKDIYEGINDLIKELENER